ncbi:sugar ABC transporter substrate-binding protein [Natranaerofaba carboxydovora]|uniref:sugar ABC transporter substrate-binding protein n=1 Tax=Natranaerofaba carboxydovora TaxID=2742683 RepID=UPI001F142E89|nr:sugar ABC transporter substrate-binding protein [Natranaerofaba carboxydovora]UMZ74815.1 Ribose import binding protein RbsB [Natranaerofaba carboxydovora]
MKLLNSKLLLLTILTVLLAAFIVTGCSPEEGKDAGGDPGMEDAEVEVDEDADLNFGMIIKYPGTPYIEAFREGAENKADELGDVHVDIRDGQADAETIMNLMDNYITQEVDGLIMAGAVDLQAIVPGIESLNEEDIPVMALDTSPEGGDIELYINFDIHEATTKAAEDFIEGIKERNDGEVPEGVVLEITGSMQDMFAQASTEAFNEVIEEYSQLEVAQGEGHWNNDDAFERTSDLLTRHGDEVLGVYVHTPDIMGPGAVSAIESHGEDPADYGITGICMGPEGLDLIKDGKVRSIVAQPAYSAAKLAVGYLNDLNEGKEIPRPGDEVDDEDAIWAPAPVEENPWADEGGYLKQQGPLVPHEVDPDDERLWENKLDHLWD